MRPRHIERLELGSTLDPINKDCWFIYGAKWKDYAAEVPINLPALNITDFKIGKLRIGSNGGNVFDVTLHVENPTSDTVPLRSLVAFMEFGLAPQSMRLKWMSNMDIEAGQQSDLIIFTIPAFFPQIIHHLTGYRVESELPANVRLDWDKSESEAVMRSREGRMERHIPCDVLPVN